MTSTVSRVLAAALIGALALAGCAAVQPAGTAAGPATAHPAAATSQSHRTSQSNEQQAERDAAAILAAFTAPPGARRLSGPPQGKASQLREIAGASASPNWIDKTGFWQVKGSPQQVLAWTDGHAGRNHGIGKTTYLPTGHTPETVWEHDYELPPVPAVEDTRELTVEVADAGHGQSAIRVDAQVTWLPARAASEVVPASATAVTLRVVPDPNLKVTPPQPVTVTRAAAVGHIAALVNALPVFPPGPRECGPPPPRGKGDLLLTFLAAPHGKVLATAYVNTEGCEPVIFTAGPRQITGNIQTWRAPGVTTLGVPFQGRALADSVLRTAGSTWNLSAY